MAIGERIRYIRNLRGMTQKYLGMAIGFDERTADVRIAQYESGARTPKEKMIANIAHILDVRPQALTVPDIDSYTGLAHTLFALEDLYGFKISRIDGELCLTLDKYNREARHMLDVFSSWHEEAERLKGGEITEDEYNAWRYTYPLIETQRFKEAVDKLRAEKRKQRTNDTPDYIKAHEFSSNHKEQILQDVECGCFYCLSIFSPRKIKKWIEDGTSGTAICPYCGIDSVIGDSSGFPVTKEFLGEMKSYWF
jgi:transcriptional regulator with XRE-family HTH domain